MIRYQKRTVVTGLALFCIVTYFSFVGLHINLRDALANSPGSAESHNKQSSSFEAEPYSIRVGRKLYTHYCQVCHGKEGQGNGFNSYTLETQPRDFTDDNYMGALPDHRLAEAVREGGPGVNKSVLMPAWGNTFNSLEINYLVLYLRELSLKNEAK